MWLRLMKEKLQKNKLEKNQMNRLKLNPENVAEKTTGSDGLIDAVGKTAPKAEPKAEAKSESMPPPPKPTARPKLETKPKAKAKAPMESPEVSADESARGGDVSGMSQTSDPDGWIARNYGNGSSNDENDSDATEDYEDFDMVVPGDPTPMEVDKEGAQQNETKEGENKEKSDEKSEEKKRTNEWRSFAESTNLQCCTGSTEQLIGCFTMHGSTYK